jgi:hypothetical protein
VLPVSARAAVAQSWNPAIAVSPAAESTEEPQAAINEHGDLAVVWENRTSGYHTKIELSRRPAGGSFSAPVTITEAPGENTSPAIALGPEGQLIVLWQTDADTEYEVRELVMASTGSIAGGQFSTPEAISGYEGGNGFMHPRAAITDGGEALAMWRGLDERIHYTERHPSGAHFAQPETIGKQGTMVFSPGGTALAVWGEGEGLAAHLVAAVEQPGLPLAPAETIEATACGELHAAINDAGDAVVDWTTTKQCESGGEPVWLRASYRPAGGHFGAPLDAAELGGWAQAGGVAVSPKGRAELSAKGWMTNPAYPGYVTALTRLPDGSYGAAETISNQELLESPPVLASTPRGTSTGPPRPATGGANSKAESSPMSPLSPARSRLNPNGCRPCTTNTRARRRSWRPAKGRRLPYGSQASSASSWQRSRLRKTRPHRRRRPGRRRRRRIHPAGPGRSPGAPPSPRRKARPHKVKLRRWPARRQRIRPVESPARSLSAPPRNPGISPSPAA